MSKSKIKVIKKWYNMASERGIPALNEQSTVKQFQEFLSFYNKLSDMCYMECAKDFSTKELIPQEVSCAANCVDKIVQTRLRVSQRFQEQQSLHMDTYKEKLMQNVNIHR